MRIAHFAFGVLEIDGVTYEHDVVIDRGEIQKRKKKASKKFRDAFGHRHGSVPAGTTALAEPAARPPRGRRTARRTVRHLWEAGLPVCPRREARPPVLPLLEGTGAEPLYLAER
jgi:hypothetical protein